VTLFDLVTHVGEWDTSTSWGGTDPRLSCSQPCSQSCSPSCSPSCSQLRSQYTVAPTSSVVSLSVPPDHATLCLAYLREHWVGNTLPIRRRLARGFASYPRTIGDHQPDTQSRNTLVVFTNALLGQTRTGLPGFADIETYLAQWLQGHYSLRALPVLSMAHVLRQGPAILGSTAFDVHRDDEEFSQVAFSVIIKLTADAVGSAPSQMRIVRDNGALFDYELV
jgi:hypothetical protein